MREYRIPGMIRWAFIVTPDGRVTEPRILHSTDERVSQYILNTIIYERYFPARFRGTPVHSLRAEQWKFGGDRAPDDRYFRDGTGINIRG